LLRSSEQKLGVFSCCGEVEVASGADGWSWECLAFIKAVGDFIEDDGAEFCIGGFFLFAVASAAEVEVWAVADVTLVLIGPVDEAVIAVRLRVAMPGQVFWFHGR
jgi:hypothetical protein